MNSVIKWDSKRSLAYNMFDSWKWPSHLRKNDLRQRWRQSRFWHETILDYFIVHLYVIKCISTQSAL